MIVTLLTDFGLRDHYVASMKGVILSANPAITIVDISHEVPAHDIRAAAFTLGSCYADFPAGTVHLAVVDPGVGSARRPICLSAAGHLFVGPDNGIFSEVLNADVDANARRIDPERVASREASTTFHGRDVFAPAAARLALGAPTDSLGPPATDLAVLEDVLPVRWDDGALAGRVVHIDRFGNCVTNLRPEDFESGNWRHHRFEVAGKSVTGTRRFYADGTGDGPFMIRGSTGRLELSIDRRHAANELRIEVGDEVVATPA